jgi:GTP-binding protein HflX
VLEEIDAHRIPRLEVMNKIDLVGMAPRIDRGEDGRPLRVWVSSKTGVGFDLLREAIDQLLTGDLLHDWVTLLPSQARLRARFYASGAVLAEEYGASGESRLELRLPLDQMRQLLAGEALILESGFNPNLIDSAPWENKVP